jgi:hypothetical protein
MSYYLARLRKIEPAAVDVPGDEQVDPKLHDADGKQLVQDHNATKSERPNWDDISSQAQLDLGLSSTERRRAMRARTLRRR